MRILITGGTGLVGTALARELRREGDEVTIVTRNPEKVRKGPAVRWHPSADRIDSAGLEGHDAAIHLAGENLFGIWTADKRRRILRSREGGTALLAAALAGLREPPRTLICASGVNYYGAHPAGAEVDEDSPPGTGFLAMVCRRWEEAAAPAKEAGIRTVHLRSGVVLSPRAGALALMLPIFRLGLGGRIGEGDQAFTWVALHEIPGIVRHVLEHEELSGPVNTCSPEVVSHDEFVRAVGRVVRRPAPFRVPEALARLLGGVVDETVLASIHAVPRRLEETGYAFRHPELEEALRFEIDAG